MANQWVRVLGAAVITLSASVASGAPVIFFGENQSPGLTVAGDPTTARNAFVAQLAGVGTETFEGFANGTTQPLSISFPGSAGNITATITDGGQGVITRVVAGANSAGRFNTTGANAAPTTGNTWVNEGRFVIDFSSPIAAFGFYGTDIGDFNGQVTIQLLATDLSVENLVVPNTINGNNASALFWGFIDPTKSYTRITFGNTAAGSDFFGFDDMTVGDRQQVRVPEPATVSLLGIGAAALALLRRRHRA